MPAALNSTTHSSMHAGPFMCEATVCSPLSLIKVCAGEIEVLKLLNASFPQVTFEGLPPSSRTCSC